MNKINPRTGKPYKHSYSEYMKMQASKRESNKRAKQVLNPESNNGENYVDKDRLQKVTGSTSPRRSPINKQQAKKATVTFDKINREPYN